MSDKLFDVIYYIDGLGQMALKHLKRLPRQEQIQRKFQVGLHFRNTKKFPYPDKCNVMGKQVMAAIHGGTWLLDTKQNDKFDYEIIQEKDGRPEIIGGILKPGVLEDEQFKVHVERSIKIEVDRDNKLASIKVQLVARTKDVTESANHRYKIMVAHLGGIKKPVKLSSQELNDVVDGIILADDVVIPSLDRWLNVQCQELTTLDTQIKSLEPEFDFNPERDDKNFESVCARIRHTQ